LKQPLSALMLLTEQQ